MADGQTTRQLIDVLEMAEGPQQILYLWPVEASIWYPMRLMTDMVRRDQPTRAFEVKGRTVLFPMTGSLVRFDYVNQFPDRHLAGRQWGSIIIDHACYDIYPRATFRWMDYLPGYAMAIEEMEGRRWRLEL